MTNQIIDVDAIVGRQMKLVKLLESIGIADIDIVVCNISERSMLMNVTQTSVTLSLGCGAMEIVAYEVLCPDAVNSTK